MDKRQSAKIMTISILFIIIGTLNIFTLPKFIFSFERSKNLYYSDMRYIGSMKEHKYKEFAESEQGKQFAKEWTAVNQGLTRNLRVSSMVCQKIIYVVFLVLGLGLLSFKEWARKMTVVVAAIQIPITILLNLFSFIFLHQIFSLVVKYDLYKLHNTDVSGLSKNQLVAMASAIPLVFFIVSAAVIVSLSGLMIYYFSKPKIKERFAISQ
ncbi:MAG: hypothetical protein PHQ96_09550 [Candidatus Omnitrophica bacterium]|nr:hypothetical protein [Candidatus Omnitrophota bacterium]